jgi:hypothetical protein
VVTALCPARQLHRTSLLRGQIAKRTAAWAIFLVCFFEESS